MVHPAALQGHWSGAVCMNFCNRMLSFIKECVVADDPHTAYLFRYFPKSQEIVCTRLPDAGEFQLLPAWYLASFTP